jgi:AcrR family transcriptional regulator
METLNELKGKIQKNKEDKKNRLMTNAIDLFGTKGYDKTSISDIVRKAGVAKGTFYLYFKSKEDLRSQIITELSTNFLNDAQDSLNESSLETFTDRLIYIINYILDALIERPDLVNILNKDLSLAFYSQEITRIVNKEHSTLHDMFMENLVKFHKKLKNPDITFFMIVELVGASCYRCLVEKFPCDIQTYKPYLYDTIRLIIDNG